MRRRSHPDGHAGEAHAPSGAGTAGSSLPQRPLADLTASELIARLAAAEDQLRWMSNSWSWRLTRPLRVALEARRRLRGWRGLHLHESTTIDPRAYAAYIASTALRESDRQAMREAILDFGYRPTISVIIPVFNTPSDWLELAIKSVLEQVYPHWELCIVDDASTQPHVASLLARYASQDSRISVSHRTENGGISPATNDGIAMATGDYIAFLDSDDELAPHALYEVAAVLQNTKYEIIYSDQDYLDSTGQRRDPLFKPDFDPELLFSMNYLNHLTVVRGELLREVGWLRPEYNGSQDYDLILRCTDKPRRIAHIPKVLYHWRAVPGSVASTWDAKPYALVAAKAALADALARRAIRGEVGDAAVAGYHRVKRDLAERPLVSIIIPFRDKAEVTRRCLASIKRLTSYAPYEIVLVDNGSKQRATRSLLARWAGEPNVRVLSYPGPFNYSAINNFAVRQATADYLVLLNNDTEVISPGWLEALLEHAQRPEVGVVGCKLLYPGGRIQHAGVVAGIAASLPGGASVLAAGHAFLGQPAGAPGYMGLPHMVRTVSAVTFACVMFRRSTLESVGGLDEVHLPVAYNDVDFCLRLREKGYEVIYTPWAVLKHHESLSRGPDLNLVEVRYFGERHAAALAAGDPYYNVNFSHRVPDFHTLRVQDAVSTM